MEKHLEAAGENKSIYHPPLHSTPHSTAGSRTGCHAAVSGEEVYLCTRHVCCQSIARGIILGIAVGVVIFSILLLPRSSIENNENVDADSSEPRRTYQGTRAVLIYLITCACIALAVEISAIVALITVRWNHLKDHPLPVFYIADVVASGCVALLYLAGGIALSYYVSLWSQPPDGCEAIRDLEINDPCSSQLLTAFGSIIAVLSFVSSITLLCQSVQSVLFVINKWDNY